MQDIVEKWEVIVFFIPKLILSGALNYNSCINLFLAFSLPAEVQGGRD